MRHVIPFIGGLIGGSIGIHAFPGSESGNQTLFGLIGGGGLFLFLGVLVWVLPAIPPPTPEQLQYRAWVDSWTPPAPQQVVYREDPHVQHQRHLQEQARQLWLSGDRDIPPGDWYA